MAIEHLIRGFCWLAGFWLLWRIKTCGPESANRQMAHDVRPDLIGDGALKVSVIIPARNEERNLPSLLQSLARQTRPADQVIVVDDSSSDATVTIAAQGGVEVVEAGELPLGWTGKSWACWKGAMASTGSLLVFLDADTLIMEDGLARLILEHSRQGGLVSVQPYHMTHRAYEQLSAFFNIILMMGVGTFTPLGERVKPIGAFGPCLVCSREDYLSVGGHDRVRGAVLEDIVIGRSFIEAGLPVRCLGGRGTIAFRMYPEGFRQMYEGWSKGFGSGALSVTAVTLLLTIAWISGCAGTAVNTVGALLAALAAPSLLPLLMAAGLCALYVTQIRWMLTRIGRFQWWTSLLYPAPLLFFVVVFFRSLVVTSVIRRVRWKGRQIKVNF